MSNDRLNRNDVEDQVAFGIVLQENGDLEGAIAAYRTALSLNPKHAKAWYHLGNALQANGDLEGAIAAYRTALRLDPDGVGAHDNLGLALAKTGDLEGAIAELRIALRLNPNDADAQYILALTLQAKGELEGAFAVMLWRAHPQLRGRFLPEHPDDLQVIVHDGGPRMTDTRPEAVWVTVTGCDSNVFDGRILNQPTQLRTVQQGQQIRFIMPAGSEHPILVTDKYMRERPLWTIHPCQTCGLSELFDAPSDLMRVVFPNIQAGEMMEACTSFCPLCGGVQGLEFRETND